jgi:type I restriction enzyme S subunit
MDKSLGLEIPFPPLEDQKRIAHLLAKVEELIARRKHHLQQLEDLLKSVFLEMFGDPVRNEKGWDTDSLSSYGSFKNGLNFGKGENGVTVRYLGVGDFKARSKLTDIDTLASIELNQLPAADYFLQDGDLLFVRSNGNRELVGRCMAVYPGIEAVTYSGFCIRLRIDKPGLDPTYIAHLFRSSAFRRTLFQGGQGANIQNINQRALSGLPIPLPSKDLQNQFAAIVEKVEDLKSRYQQSLTDLGNLYGALSQKAFKGELDLSRVALPAEGPDTAEEEKIDIEEKQPMEPLFALPAPGELAVLETAEGRKSLLGEWLDAWLGHLDDAPFSAQAFMDAARQRLWELAEDDAPDWGAAEYDELKTWVFEALKQGRLAQAYDDANNRVQVTAAKR